ncbi:MAG: carboxymuconolactone decarboxylase family protein [Candidatus Rokubacteria bacterium]|nr:carboxymuconolactone decarboxylase family protein [Candidatus Rokubacteria bacterium]
MDIRHAVGVKAGVPDAKLEALADWTTSEVFTARERVALEFAERIVRDDDAVSDECYARVREHFSEPEIVELVFVVGYQTFASQFAKAFSLEPQGFSV